MYNCICENCGNEFEHREKTTKFCSRQCYYNSRKGVKRPEHGEKIRRTMLSKNLSYKGTERAINIGIANSKEGLTKGCMEKIKEGIEKYYYVTNPEILLKHININVRNGLSEEVSSIIRKNNNFFKGRQFFPLEVQSFPLEKMQNIIKDSRKIPWDKMMDKYNITETQYFSILSKHGIKDYCYKNSGFNETRPEKIIKGILEKLNIPYNKEKYLKHRTFRCDFIIDNYILEVQGDYWHGNRRLFDFAALNNIQLDKKKRDAEKFNYAIKKGYNVIEIWEMDIYNKVDNVEKELFNIFKEKMYNGVQYFSSEFF